MATAVREHPKDRARRQGSGPDAGARKGFAIRELVRVRSLDKIRHHRFGEESSSDPGTADSAFWSAISSSRSSGIAAADSKCFSSSEGS
jgi:hypothetical protein